MLQRNQEFGDEADLPIVSICIITDRNRCPPTFNPVLKCHDDGTDADLWKDGFGFGIFNRSVRYVAVSRIIPESGIHEVVTDLAIITEKEAVPTNFVCIDFTADTKERALKKKFICVRFTPRNDAIDALTDVIVMNKTKRPPKGFTSAGEVDGALICFKVSTMNPNYGVKQIEPRVAAAGPSSTLYPSLSDDPALAAGMATIRLPNAGQHKGVDGVPFKLNSRFANSLKLDPTDDPAMWSSAAAVSNIALEEYDYNFTLEHSIVTH